jgi:hypothetical protein
VQVLGLRDPSPNIPVAGSIGRRSIITTSENVSDSTRAASIPDVPEPSTSAVVLRDIAAR